MLAIDVRSNSRDVPGEQPVYEERLYRRDPVSGRSYTIIKLVAIGAVVVEPCRLGPTAHRAVFNTHAAAKAYVRKTVARYEQEHRP